MTTTDIEALVLIDKQIDENESCALRARWEFGREMLAARDGAGRLPNRMLTEVSERTGKARAEIGHRMRFAARFHTEDELANAVSTFGSWHQIVKNLKAENDAVDNAPVAPPPALEGKYHTLVADPPWQYDNTAARGAAENHYGTMTIAELCELDVAKHAADNAHLYMWTTSAHLPHAFDVMAAWGFEYKTYLVWVKPQIGMGNYFRTCTELVLFGVRGSMRTQARDVRNWFEAPRSKHSAKPPEFHDIVMRASAEPYLELFTRCRNDDGCQCSKCRYGWATWGNQA
jgi:N6-adenosine-specific RNA methylase IME4